jgi:glutathione synthase
MAKRAPRKSFLWVTDPWTTLDHKSDTSLRLALEARSLGHESHFCDVKSVRWENGRVAVDVCDITPELKLIPLGAKHPRDYHQLHYRVDPPIDLDYLHPLQLLIAGLPSRGTEIVNPYPVLTSHNEKLEASFLRDLMPPTFIGCRWEELLSFGIEEGRTVLKPLHQAQSKGVELLHWGSTEAVGASRELLRRESRDFSTPVLLQRYLSGIAEGETRLWFIDGRLLASVKKLPLKGDFRVNIDRGSGLAEIKLSRHERSAAQRIGKHLKLLKIRMAAVDLIDGYVTDFNFTSPGLITQMEKLLGENLARKIIDSLSKR